LHGGPRESGQFLLCVLLVLQDCNGVSHKIHAGKTHSSSIQLCTRYQCPEHPCRYARIHSPLASHSHDSNCVLWIRIDLCLENSIDCIGLGTETRWLIVTVAHELGIVYYHHRCFKRHDGRRGRGRNQNKRRNQAQAQADAYFTFKLTAVMIFATILNL